MNDKILDIVTNFSKAWGARFALGVNFIVMNEL